MVVYPTLQEEIEQVPESGPGIPKPTRFHVLPALTHPFQLVIELLIN